MTTSAGNPKSAIQNPKPEASRRDFLALVGRGALWATAGFTIVALLRYLSFTESTPPQVFVLDKPSAYPPGIFTPVAEGRAFIGHEEGGLYAINATCTHLGCIVKRANTGFQCPCHGSQFRVSGAVTHGPATQSLNYAALTLNSAGQVVLDLGHTVATTVRLPVT